MKKENLARLFLFGLLLGVPLAIFLARAIQPASAGMRTIELHGIMADDGGWTPADITLAVGEPLLLRLISDDVMHGFAIGQSDAEPVDIYPGKVVEKILQFDKPGKYSFYCTRWCGLNHWRMRGTIEVVGETLPDAPADVPLFVQLGLDIDAPHPAASVPSTTPSALRGSLLQVDLPRAFLDRDYLRTQSPAVLWQKLRANPATRALSDPQVWDLVAFLWTKDADQVKLAEAAKIFAENCAACHGESGAGDGVFVDELKAQIPAGSMPGIGEPTDFTNPNNQLGASSAIMHGKIVRGGMGTGMPYWGSIFTDDQIWSLIDYIWTFQFPQEINQ